MNSDNLHPFLSRFSYKTDDLHPFPNSFIFRSDILPKLKFITHL